LGHVGIPDEVPFNQDRIETVHKSTSRKNIFVTIYKQEFLRCCFKKEGGKVIFFNFFVQKGSQARRSAPAKYKTGAPPPGAQGIEAEILLAQPKDWSEKPGLRRFTPQMRPNSEL
jgi:hypothetical protein